MRCAYAPAPPVRHLLEGGRVVAEGWLSELHPPLFRAFSRKGGQLLQKFGKVRPRYRDLDIYVYFTLRKHSRIISPAGLSMEAYDPDGAHTRYHSIELRVSRADFAGKRMSPSEVKSFLKLHRAVLWHEYVHFLQYKGKLVQEASKFRQFISGLLKRFLGETAAYYRNPMEQHAYLEEYREMRERGLSDEEIKREMLHQHFLEDVADHLRLSAVEEKLLTDAALRQDAVDFLHILEQAWARRKRIDASTIHYFTEELYDDVQAHLRYTEKVLRLLQRDAEKYPRIPIRQDWVALY